MKILRRDGRERVASERSERTSPLRGERRGRYHLAAPFVFNRTVLEVTRGSRFGSRILAEAGAVHVTEVDITQGTSEAEAFGLDIVTSIRADATALPLKDGVFDVAVAFETIEHLDEADRFLDELSRTLRPGGTLLVSTTNRSIAPPEASGYAPADFKELLARHFDRVELKGQHVDPRYPAGRRQASPSLPSKLQTHLPYALNDRLSRLAHNRGFYPGEFDYLLTDDLDGARVLVGRCER